MKQLNDSKSTLEAVLYQESSSQRAHSSFLSEVTSVSASHSSIVDSISSFGKSDPLRSPSKSSSGGLLSLIDSSSTSSPLSLTAMNEAADLKIAKSTVYNSSSSGSGRSDSRSAGNEAGNRKVSSSKALYVLPPLLDIFAHFAELNSGFVASKIETDVMPVIISILTSYCREFIGLYGIKTSKGHKLVGYSQSESASGMKFSVESKIKLSIIAFLDRMLDVFSVRSSFMKFNKVLSVLLVPFLSSSNSVSFFSFIHPS